MWLCAGWYLCNIHIRVKLLPGNRGHWTWKCACSVSLCSPLHSCFWSSLQLHVFSHLPIVTVSHILLSVTHLFLSSSLFISVDVVGICSFVRLTVSKVLHTFYVKEFFGFGKPQLKMWDRLEIYEKLGNIIKKCNCYCMMVYCILYWMRLLMEIKSKTN